MSRQSVDIVRQATALMAEGDLQGALRLTHPDIEWVIAKEHPNARTIAGYEALREYQRDWQEMLPDVHFELERLLDGGDTVVGIGNVRGTGAGSGADVRVPIGFVYTLRDGLIVRIEEYLDQGEALAAAGLAA